MTIKAPAGVLLLLYQLAAEEAGASVRRLLGHRRRVPAMDLEQARELALRHAQRGELVLLAFRGSLEAEIQGAQLLRRARKFLGLGDRAARVIVLTSQRLLVLPHRPRDDGSGTGRAGTESSGRTWYEAQYATARLRPGTIRTRGGRSEVVLSTALGPRVLTAATADVERLAALV